MTNISTIGQLVDNNSRLKSIQSQIGELQIQLASGKKARFLDGLGPDALGSIRNRASIDQISAYQTNITVGTARIKQITQSVLEFRQQAQNVVDAMTGQLENGELNLDSIREFARTALTRNREILNTKEGDRYIFAASDAFNEPLADVGSLPTYMTSLVEDWKDTTITTDQIIDAYKATPETTTGYSAALSSGSARSIFIRADVNVDVDYTVFANSEPFKNIINSLSLLENLELDKIALDDDDNPTTTETAPGADRDEQKDNFYKLYGDIIRTINTSLDEIEKETERLQQKEVVLNGIAENHKSDKNTLEEALSDVEDVDITDVAVKINSLQIQLSAAYQVTARLGQLTLSQFI